MTHLIAKSIFHPGLSLLACACLTVRKSRPDLVIPLARILMGLRIHWAFLKPRIQLSTWLPTREAKTHCLMLQFILSDSPLLIPYFNFCTKIDTGGNREYFNSCGSHCLNHEEQNALKIYVLKIQISVC